jgi:predicted CoA-binding protein
MGYQEDEAVSASEKLKALGGGFDRVTPIMRKTGPKMLGSEAYVHAKDIHAYVDALPQIVALVREQEFFTETMWTVQNGDAEPFVSQEGLRYLYEHLERAAAALSALEEALT